jgi:ribonucleoside-diphosphate reductase alpha chain
VTSS